MRPVASTLALLLSATAVAADCPPARDISDEQAAIYTALQTASSPAAALPLVGELWALWTDAPDAKAQYLLDQGMQARASFDYDRAKAALDDLVDYCPAFTEGYNQRAFVAFLRADYANALVDLEAALSLNPDHMAALSGLGLTLMRLGRHEASQDALRRAVRLNPWLRERGLITPPQQAPGDEL